MQPTPRDSSTPLSRRHATSRIALCALAAALAGCGDAVVQPAAQTLTRADRLSGNPHAQPELFSPGVISDAREQWRITFTPDGDTAYYTVSDEFFPISRRATIVVSHRTGDGWTAPQVASFSGVYPDIDPFITPDGRRLFFSSIRPVDGQARADLNLWVMERTAEGWSEPVHLGPAVNSASDELYASVDAAGMLYFASQREGSDWNIFRAGPSGGGYPAVERLGAAVNSASWDFNPEISPDGRTLLFTSLNRPGGLGMGDLYVSHLHRGQWTTAENLGAPVNSAIDEYHATVSPDRKQLYFVRHSYAPWKAGDFYRIEVARLGNRLRPGGGRP